MSTLHILSTLVVALIAGGVLTRATPAVHMRFMTAAFAIDLALVLYIEATRHAVARVVGPAGALLWFHAAVSTSVLLLYGAQLTLGRRMLAGRTSAKGVHAALGLTFCLFRLTNYATAFMVSASLAAPLPAQAAAPRPPLGIARVAMAR